MTESADWVVVVSEQWGWKSFSMAQSSIWRMFIGLWCTVLEKHVQRNDEDKNHVTALSFSHQGIIYIVKHSHVMPQLHTLYCKLHSGYIQSFGILAFASCSLTLTEPGEPAPLHSACFGVSITIKNTVLWYPVPYWWYGLLKCSITLRFQVSTKAIFSLWVFLPSVWTSVTEEGALWMTGSLKNMSLPYFQKLWGCFFSLFCVMSKLRRKNRNAELSLKVFICRLCKAEVEL